MLSFNDIARDDCLELLPEPEMEENLNSPKESLVSRDAELCRRLAFVGRSPRRQLHYACLFSVDNNGHVLCVFGRADHFLP